MFGRRSDGYLIRKIDPIVALMPHIMSQRNDAMVQLEYEIDYGKLARYVVRKEQEDPRERRKSVASGGSSFSSSRIFMFTLSSCARR